MESAAQEEGDTNSLCEEKKGMKKKVDEDRVRLCWKERKALR
jgi:hypothetical protein